MDFKKCNDCKKEREINDFWNNKHNSDGKDGICKFCRKERSNRYNERNKDRIRQWGRDYRKKRNPKHGTIFPERVKTKIDWIPSYDIENYKKETGYIYLLQETTFTNHVKIGKTKNLHNRKRNISNSLPFEVNLETLYCIKTDDMHRVERDLQIKFHEKRRKGEWFELDEEDLKKIMKLLDKFDLIEL